MRTNTAAISGATERSAALRRDRQAADEGDHRDRKQGEEGDQTGDPHVDRDFDQHVVPITRPREIGGEDRARHDVSVAEEWSLGKQVTGNCHQLGAL